MSDETTTDTAPAPAPGPGDTVLTNNASGPGGDASSDPVSPPGDEAPDTTATPDVPKGQESGEEGTGDPSAEATPATAGAPEEYGDFTTDNQVNEEGMSRFKEFAKRSEMSQEAAQATLSYIEKEMPQFIEQVQQQQLDAYMQQTKEWKESYEKDPNIGGTKMRETETAAKRAIDYLNDPNLTSILDSYNPETNPNGMGIGNHPAIINMLAQFGKTLAEDTHAGGDQNQGGGNASTPEERWYPT